MQRRLRGHREGTEACDTPLRCCKRSCSRLTRKHKRCARGLIASTNGNECNMGVFYFECCEMPVGLFRWAYVVPAITATAGVCIHAFIKSMIRAACANDGPQQSSNDQSQAIVASLVFAAMAVTANAAFLVFKSRNIQGLALFFEICVNWQPAYFVLVSIQRIVFLALVVAGDSREDSEGACGFSSHQLGQILATELLMPIALLLFTLSSICCDYDPDFTPAMRRGTYAASSACFALDMICSFVWGFGTNVNRGLFSFGPFRFVLSNQIASCAASQVAILLHVLYVSCRSRRGLGWAYESLRFELVKERTTGELLNEPYDFSMTSHMPNSSGASQGTQLSVSPTSSQMPSFNGASEGVHGREVQAPEHSNVFSRLLHRLLRFRRQCLQTSRVFAIPCVESASNLRSTASGLEVERPLIRIKLLPDRILRVAELHDKLYIWALFIVVLVSMVCSQLQLERTGTASLVLNIILLYGILGFFSCKRHNFGSVAAKHVSSSFQFVSICVVFLFYVAVNIRYSYIGQRSPQISVAYIMMMLIYILCLLADCSPNLPAIVQTAISVRLFILY